MPPSLNWPGQPDLTDDNLIQTLDSLKIDDYHQSDYLRCGLLQLYLVFKGLVV